MHLPIDRVRAPAGYLLLRGMIEEDLRKKREQQMQQAAAREAARQMAGMMPLLALLQLSETTESPAKQVALVLITVYEMSRVRHTPSMVKD